MVTRTHLNVTLYLQLHFLFITGTSMRHVFFAAPLLSIIPGHCSTLTFIITLLSSNDRYVFFVIDMELPNKPHPVSYLKSANYEIHYETYFQFLGRSL